MKVLEIAPMNNIGSIGKIASQIQSLLKSVGDECVVAYSLRSNPQKVENTYKINGWFEAHAHNRLARITKLTDSLSLFHTLKLIRMIKRYKPDVIHLHLIQENYLNLRALFNFFSHSDIPIIWTFHDCRGFTGGCPYFTVSGCMNWKNVCENCPLHQDSAFDQWSVRHIYSRNKTLFTSLKHLTIVTPSQWLCSLIKESFLAEYPVKVINNGIDLNVFSPKQSDFRKKYKIESKYVLLGVAFAWGYRKGLDVFCKIAEESDDSYQVILVGTNDQIDQNLPKNVISIHRTNNMEEMAEIYSAADLFINPTREDNFPTTNIEALACGTPVLTFNTGGSPEIIDDTCGFAAPYNDVDALMDAIQQIRQKRPFTREACVSRALLYNKNDRFQDYVSLYHEVLNGKNRNCPA